MPHRFAVTPKAVYGLGLIIGVLGCNSPGRVVGPTLGEVSLRIPGGRIFQLSAGSDGSLFASGTGGVYRRRNEQAQWELLIPTPENITRMYSPSADDLFALAGDCSQLYQWSSSAAWRRVKLPTSDSTLGSGTPGRCIDLYDIWGRKSTDVYIVGERGTIIHYDGASWTLESDPLIPERNPEAFLGYATLWSVSGDSERVFVAGGGPLVKDSGVWTLVKPPATTRFPAYCDYGAVAVYRGDAYFAYNRCLIRLRENTLSLFTPQIPGLSGTIYRGQSQLDGTALFWTYYGEVVELSPEPIHLYSIDSVRAVGSAVLLGDYLYVGARRGRDGVVLRIPRRSKRSRP
ncbi:MAG: hypothetical protein ACR2OG_12500 [Gemmatimonadaceae bacterium]